MACGDESRKAGRKLPHLDYSVIKEKGRKSQTKGKEKRK